MITDSSFRFKLLIVTKGHSAEEVAALLRENPRFFRIGENRVEEAEEKFLELRTMIGKEFERLEKHFIGKLQSRKIKEVARLFDVVQSVETEEQARRLSDAAGALGKTLKVFIEVNLTGLPGRSGVLPTDFTPLREAVLDLPHLHLQGVMGMASPDVSLAAEALRGLKTLQGKLEDCSMGMSGDYAQALEAGSTMLRLGRLIFEEGLPKNLLFE